MKSDKLEKLLEAGSFMANIIFNAKRDKNIPEGWRIQFDRLQTAWDNAHNAYTAELNERKAARRKAQNG